MTGFVVFAHGSRVESANEAVRRLALRMAQSCGEPVEPAFLELGDPDLTSAIGRVAARGVSRVVVIPYFLTTGTHLQRDLPQLIEDAASRHPGVTIEATPPLDGHPALLDILLDRAREATP